MERPPLRWVVFAAALLVGSSAEGWESDLFLVVAGQVRSASGKEFHTTVWITNLASRRTTVLASFLERHPLKASPPSVSIDLEPAQTKEIPDLPLLLRRPNTVGAIRFQSAEPIAASARIYSGITGETFAAVSYDAGLARRDEALIPGVIYGGSDFRYTTYLVETAGRPIGLLVRLVDANGRELAHDNFILESYEHRSLPIEELAPGVFVRNGSIRIRVTAGGGRLYAKGLQIPIASGDGSFFDMTVLRSSGGSGLSASEAIVYSLTALAVIAAVAFQLYRRERHSSG